MKEYRKPEIKDVLIRDGFFSPRLDTNLKSIIPAVYRQCKETGRIDAWKWKEGMPDKPHIFWDSDVAKWIESASYSLIHNPDKEIEAKIDGIAEMMEAVQLPDGYLNSYYINVEPQNRFTFLRNNHELYCAGHLIEAAVAYHEATGKDNLLNIMRRYADLIDKTFGPEEGKIHGYDGHQEIELALVKLYKSTSENRYLNLAKYFLDERGKQPLFFDIEAERRGEKVNTSDQHRYKNLQAHLPVRQQKTAEGHAVRCCYMLAGMAESAVETGDVSLLAACREIWKSIVGKRIYINGGVGSTSVSLSRKNSY
ncbi:MAG: beta-L-arabinofuranosidase domain-containing protein [Lentisphaerota bacterium]